MGQQERESSSSEASPAQGPKGAGGEQREGTGLAKATADEAAAPAPTLRGDGRGDRVRNSTGGAARPRRHAASPCCRRGERRKDRVVTYVSGVLHSDETGATPADSEEDRRRNIELGNRAVAVVLAFEQAHSRNATPRGQTHPGYDVDSSEPVVDSLDPKNGATRSIEVKGISGPWTRLGVALSPRQFQAARQLGDSFWLYVVEHADDPAKAVVHPIQNPFAKVTGYWFDRGRMQLVDPNEVPSRQGRAEVGQRISMANVGEGTILDITQRGVLRVLLIRLDDGREVKRPFNPHTMQVQLRSARRGPPWHT